MCDAATAQILLHRLPQLGHLYVAREHIVHRRHLGLRIEAQVQRRMRLRIDVDEPDALPCAGQRGAQVDRGRRFADAALLIDDGDGAHEWGQGTGG